MSEPTGRQLLGTLLREAERLPVVLTRRQLAGFLDCHPDTVSDKLAEDPALQACRITRGGHGRRAEFDTPMVVKWAVLKYLPEAYAEMCLDDMATWPDGVVRKRKTR